MEKKKSPMADPNEKPKKVSKRKPAVSKEAKKIAKRADKLNEQTLKEAKEDRDKALGKEVIRDEHGHFIKGHAPQGGAKAGQRQKLSLMIQNKILSVVSEELETERFSQGLIDLYTDDPKGYYSAMTALMKFCTPALASQSIDLNDNTAKRTIDDRLDELMKKRVPIPDMPSE